MPGVEIPEIDPATAAARFAGGTDVLLDVREPDEWEAGHIAGAMHIPLGKLDAGVGDLPADRGVIVVCRTGGRAGKATTALRASGIDARNLTGGMQAWEAAALPLEPPDGRVA